MTAPYLRTKNDFIAAIGEAVTRQSGFAVGKIGYSEQHWLYLPIFLERQPTPPQRQAYQLVLAYHCDRQSGVYPSDPRSVLAFNAFYAPHFGNLDCLGLFGGGMEPPILSHYGVSASLFPYQTLEPDRSSPNDPSLCYLEHFRGKKLLLLAPFADLLKARANQTTFEGVWAKTGKPWFYPASVDAVEFPYGYVSETRQRFPTVVDLFGHIIREVETRDFDIALIAAGGLGIPLASQIKRMGRVAISLGGHLQVLFGVLGARWINRRSWQDLYFNEHWIKMPARYHPPDKERLTDQGAYW